MSMKYILLIDDKMPRNNALADTKTKKNLIFNYTLLFRVP